MLTAPNNTPHVGVACATPTSCRNERAQATVELALVLPIVAMLLFGIIQFGILFWQYQQISAAASEGARRAAVSRINNPTQSAIDAAKSAVPDLSQEDLTVAVNAPNGWLSGRPVQVSVSYPAELTILGVTLFSGSLQSTRTTRLE